MISSGVATIIMICLTIFLIIIVPIFDSSEKLGKYVSLRYTLTAITVVLSVGVLIDFSHLETQTRNIVLMGSFILVGLFVLVRSLEKLKYGAKAMKFTIKKGDVEAGMEVKNKVQDNQDSATTVEQNKETQE